MNQEVKDKWITALEFGGYSQGNGALRQNDKFCCLGVLCDIAVEDGIISEPNAIHYSGGIEYRYGPEGNVAFLPSDVMDWAGLRSDSPMVGEESLVALNDDGVHFTDIAAKIREYL